jgi:hypothetical protein
MMDIPPTSAPIMPNCGQDQGHPKDMIRLEQVACIRCDRYFLMTQLRDEPAPQFDDIVSDGRSVTHCPRCNQALSLATVYDPNKHEHVMAQLIKRRSEVGDEDALIDELEAGLAAVHSYMFTWDLWSYLQQTQRSAA